MDAKEIHLMRLSGVIIMPGQWQVGEPYLAISGFHYSAVTAEMSFAEKPGNWFWSNGYSWGTVKISEQANHYTVTLESIKGKTSHLKKFSLVKIQSF